jgi:hypothetical protein
MAALTRARSLLLLYFISANLGHLRITRGGNWLIGFVLLRFALFVFLFGLFFRSSSIARFL